MSFKISKTVLLIIVLMLLGTVLRFWQLGSLPAVLHRDEAAIGYNAYSLLQTGRDEHNQLWPFTFRSFGDYKLPGLMYTTAISVHMFGLTPWAVRFPTAVAAVLTIPALFWLARSMGWSSRVAVLAAVFITFDFWHIAQARNAYEPMVGLLFSVAGLASWLQGQKQPKYVIAAVLCYAMGALFYNVPFLLMPLLYGVSWLVLQDWKLSWKAVSELIRLQRAGIAGLIMVVCIALSVAYLTRDIAAGKSNTTVFSHADVTDTAATQVHAGLVAGMPSLFARGLSHPVIIGVLQAAKGYAAAFNPTYLYFDGDHNPWHNLRAINLGNSNPALLVIAMVGLFVLLQQRRKKPAQLTLMYLLIAPTISALTIDAPITNRLLDFHTAVLLVAAVGVAAAGEKIWSGTRSVKNKVMARLSAYGWIALYLGFCLFFIVRYFYLYNPLLEPLWNPGLVDMITTVESHGSAYDTIFVTSDLTVGYSFFAFYTKFDPADFQQHALWERSGFEEVIAYRQYHFVNFPNWTELSAENVATYFNPQQKKLLIVQRGKPSDEQQLVLWQHTDWRGRVLWSLWSVDAAAAAAKLATLPQTADRTRTIDYLRTCMQSECTQSSLSNTK